MQLKRMLAGGAAAAVLAFGLSACGSAATGASGGSGGGGSSGQAWATVNIGLALSPPKAVFFAPYVAQQEGFFAKEHLHVKFISMPNGLQTELGTTAGTIQFGLSSGTDSIEAAAANDPIHAVWSYGTKLDTECIAAPEIHTAKDLIGKPVGSTGTGGFSYTTLNACLAPKHVKISQTKPINMTRSEFVPALIDGKIDAAVFHADDAYVVLHQDSKLHVIAKEYQTYPNWWYGGVAVKDAYAKSHPQIVERFLTAMVLADRWMYKPSNFNKLVAIGTKASGEDKAAVAYAVKFLLSIHEYPINNGLPKNEVMWTTKTVYDLKEINKEPTYNQIVNPTYIDAVIKKVGKASYPN